MAVQNISGADIVSTNFPTISIPIYFENPNDKFPENRAKRYRAQNADENKSKPWKPTNYQPDDASHATVKPEN